MNRDCLNFNDPIRDAISRIRFAPFTNNLLISSWDSNLRLYDVDKSELRLESPTEEALLDCCFESEIFAASVGSNGSVCRYDMHVGTSKAIGNHDDLATCIEYSEETHQIISSGWDKKVKSWDARLSNPTGCLSNLDMEVESMTLSGFNLMIAVRSSIYIYDLRSFHESVQAKESNMGVHIKSVRSISNVGGFAIGSIDGRVALEYFCQSNRKNEGYTFKCHPKDRNGRHYLVAVNDITFNPSYVLLSLLACSHDLQNHFNYRPWCLRVCGVFVTGDNEGHATIWDALSKKRLLELSRYPNSVASLTYNHDGQLLAVASSYTYQEACEREKQPQIFVHHMDDDHIRSGCSSSSQRKVMM